MRPYRWISAGFGTQSTALLVLSALEMEGVPKADAAVFADTGHEPAWVYETRDFYEAWAGKRGTV